MNCSFIIIVFRDGNTNLSWFGESGRGFRFNSSSAERKSSDLKCGKCGGDGEERGSLSVVFSFVGDSAGGVDCVRSGLETRGEEEEEDDDDDDDEVLGEVGEANVRFVSGGRRGCGVNCLGLCVFERGGRMNGRSLSSIQSAISLSIVIGFSFFLFVCFLNRDSVFIGRERLFCGDTGCDGNDRFRRGNVALFEREI